MGAVDVNLEDAPEKLKAGLDLVADVVKITLGPRGRYVTLYNGPKTYPTVTNDGVTIAKRIELEQHYEDTGAQLIQEASIKTNDIAGDGTTTACVLMQAIVNEAQKAIKDGAQPLVLTESLKKHAKTVLEHAKAESKQVGKNVKTLANVATISCRDEKVGFVVADLLHKLGPDSYVTIEDFSVEALIPEQKQGLRVRGMLPSTYFFTNKSLQEAVMPITKAAVRVAVVDQPLTHAGEVIKIMQTVAEMGEKEAVVIAPDFGNLALATIIENWEQGLFKLLPMKVIAYGPSGEGYMRDICAVTGGEYISTKDGRSILELQPEWLGAGQKVICTFHELAILGGYGDVDERIKELKAQLPLLREFEADSARERIAKLQSKIATIKVGAETDSERETKKYLVEDAINACRAALRGGVVSGGGATLYRASRKLDSRDIAQRVLQDACEAPLRQIAANSEVNLGVEVLDQLTAKKGQTVDFKTGEVVDGYKAGIIDPYNVLETALTNAVSQACLFILTAAAIAPVYDEE